MLLALNRNPQLCIFIPTTLPISQLLHDALLIIWAKLLIPLPKYHLILFEGALQLSEIRADQALVVAWVTYDVATRKEHGFPL
jgi:hypothetical protein